MQKAKVRNVTKNFIMKMFGVKENSVQFNVL